MALTALCRRPGTPRSTAAPQHRIEPRRQRLQRGAPVRSAGAKRRVNRGARTAWLTVPQPGLPSARGRPYQLP